MTNVKFAPKENMDNRVIHLYSDGGCRLTAKLGETIKKTDKCAFAFFLRQGGHEKLDGWAGYGKTNNAMEISGLLHGLNAIKNTNVPVIAYLDSAYVVNTLEKKWYEKWERDGWTKKGGLKNAELWKELINRIREFPFFSIEKVKGHSDDEYNNLVDKHLNELMDALSDTPVLEEKSMLEDVIDNNKPKNDNSSLFQKNEEIKYNSDTIALSDMPSVIKIDSQRAFSREQLNIMLPEVVEQMAKADLTESIAKEIVKYTKIDKVMFGDNVVYKTEVNILNGESKETKDICENNKRRMINLLDALLIDPEIKNSQKIITKEIKEILNG